MSTCYLFQLTPEPENANVSSYMMKPKGGRRRWGHISGILKGEDWDDYEDLDTTTTAMNKPSFVSNDKRWQDNSLNRSLGHCV